MRMRHVKTKWMFDIDVLLRRSIQHSAVWRLFCEQPNAIRRLSVLQIEFICNTFRCRVSLLHRRMPNSIQKSTCSALSRFHMPCLCLRSDVNPVLSKTSVEVHGTVPKVTHQLVSSSVTLETLYGIYPYLFLLNEHCTRLYHGFMFDCETGERR